MSFARQCSDITYPVVARTAMKEIPKNQCRQCGVAASTATPDDDTFVIDKSLCNEEFSTIDTIIDVNVQAEISYRKKARLDRNDRPKAFRLSRVSKLSWPRSIHDFAAGQSVCRASAPDRGRAIRTNDAPICTWPPDEIPRGAIGSIRANSCHA